jgi:hypothetical protein
LACVRGRGCGKSFRLRRFFGQNARGGNSEDRKTNKDYLLHAQAPVLKNAETEHKSDSAKVFQAPELFGPSVNDVPNQTPGKINGLGRARRPAPLLRPLLGRKICKDDAEQQGSHEHHGEKAQ